MFYHNSHHAATVHWILLYLQSFILPKNTERACIKGLTLYFWGLSPNDKTSSGTEQVYRRAKDPVEIVVFVSPFFLFYGVSNLKMLQNSANSAHISRLMKATRKVVGTWDKNPRVRLIKNRKCAISIFFLEKNGKSQKPEIKFWVVFLFCFFQFLDILKFCILPLLHMTTFTKSKREVHNLLTY